MFLAIIFVVSCIKVLLIPSYHSTDFEVHRNWLALTHSLPISEWYYEQRSEWTLDYPPLFAWFEYGLSHIAKVFDPEMLSITNLNYKSDQTVLFQRLSVIVTDLVFAMGVKRCCDSLSDRRTKILVFLLIFGNAGLIMVDHIHFQYNGILFGLLLLSFADAIKNKYLSSALWFSILLNMKHIYLYIAPAYIVYLFRSYCFTVASRDGLKVAWYSFSINNLLKLGAVVLGVSFMTFAPFYKHLPQILSRLFPFKRGLSHAYWAPNMWALYNIADKGASFLLTKLGYNLNTVKGAMTGGLVQEYSHAVLPSISPLITLILSVMAMLPALLKLWELCADRRKRPIHFIRCVVICAASSFIFGWHVHEKAILMIIIPLSILAALDPYDCRVFLILSTLGHYSLFPLLYPSNLLPIKICLLLLHSTISFAHLPALYACKKPAPGSVKGLPMLNFFETIYLIGFIPLCLYENVFHFIFKLNKTYQFLPLMITSVYCAIGVLYCWIRLYGNFLSMSVLDSDGRTKKVK